MAASTFHVTTFGCQMNQHDSERIDGLLESLGYAQAEAASEADLIVLNTCSIRESADRRLETQLGNAKRFKAARPGVIVAVGGCWAQSLKDEVFERYPFVDVAFGPGQVDQLGEFLLSDSVRAQGYFEFGGFTGELFAWPDITRPAVPEPPPVVVPAVPAVPAAVPATPSAPQSPPAPAPVKKAPQPPKST